MNVPERKVVAFDFETHLIRPAQMAPPPVCLSWQSPGEEASIAHCGSAIARISDQPAHDLLVRWLTTDTILVGHNVSYDLGAACARWPELVRLVFTAYDQDRIADTMIRQQLLDIAAGQFRGREQRFPKEVTLSEDDVKDLIEVGMDIPENGKKTIWASKWVQHNYGLDDIIWRAAGRRLDKGADSWRLRYAELADVPLEQWPPEAVAYPLEDARATLDIYLAQEVHKEFIKDHFRQAYAAWSLFLIQTWGLRTHGPGVDALERETIAALGEIEDGLKAAGLVRTGERVVVLGLDGKPKVMKNGKVRTRSGGKPGSKDTKVAKRRMIEVCQRRGKPVRLTDKGGICLDSDACEASGDDLLEDYAELSALKKLISNEIPTLRMGTVYPIHTSYGLAASGRSTSCIAKGSKIQMPCHRGRYPQGKPIEEIVAGDRVYSYDLEGRLYLQRVLWAGCTGNKPVVKVTWRGQGRKHSGELLLTADHHVMLFEGIWREAGALRPGDRVTALSAGTRKREGYKAYWHLYSRYRQDTLEHVFANEQLTGIRHEAVHHVDHDVNNNELYNLCGMTAEDHHKLHHREASPETLAKRIAVLLDPETRRRRIAAIKRGPENPCWMSVPRWTLLRWAALSAGKIRYMMELSGHDYEFLHAKMRLHGIDLMKLRKRYNLDGQYLSKRVVRLAAQLEGNARHKTLKIGYYRFPEMVDFWGLSNNHEILSVEPAGFSDVYDLEVENTSTFIANELCVHNSKPNVQNPKQKNEVIRNGELKYRLPDVREIWMPRPGYIYAQADFSSMELCTLAQCCITLFGESELAKTINAGRDPLTEFAINLLPGNVSYEEGIARKKSGADDSEFYNARQASKVAMYGMPGGLGADTLVLFARKSYNVTLTADETPRTGARWLKAAWLARFPEMRKFFDYCGGLVDRDRGEGSMLLPFSQRWRGGTHYTGICNSWFQGWASDSAKRATCLVQRACYAEPESVLYNSRPVLFVHDELVTEVLNDYYAHDKAVEMARLMVQGANEFLPDVPVRADPQLMTVWSKSAIDVFDERGRLVAWDPDMKARKAVVYDKKGKRIEWSGT